MKMPAATLAKLVLEEHVRDVIDRARKITAPGARRRAERALAGDLRRLDLGAIARRVARAEVSGKVETELLHVAERWRTRLIDEGPLAAATFPGGDVERLAVLVANAQRERTLGTPPGAARALFRHIMAVLKAQAEAAAKVAEDAADAEDVDAEDAD